MPYFENNIEQSNILGINIKVPENNRMYSELCVYYKDGTYSILYHEKIICFYLRCIDLYRDEKPNHFPVVKFVDEEFLLLKKIPIDEFEKNYGYSKKDFEKDHQLSVSLCFEIYNSFAFIFNQFDGEDGFLNDLSYPDNKKIKSAYIDTYNMILAKKKEAHLKQKPLLLILAENHMSPTSLFYEMLILDIARHIGIKNIFFEHPSDSDDISVPTNNRFSNECMRVIKWIAKNYKIATMNIDMNSKELLTAVYHKEDNTLEIIDLDKTINGRNKNMISAIVDAYKKDKNSNPKLEKKLSILICGAGHVPGIIKDEAIIENFECLPLDIYFNIVFRRIIFGKELPLTSVKEYNLIFYDNLRMFRNIVMSGREFQNERLEVLNAEIRALLEGMKKIIERHSRNQNFIDRSRSNDVIILAENMIKVIKSIENDTNYIADIKRFEIYSALCDTKVVIKNKKLEGSLLDRIINEFIKSFSISSTMLNLTKDEYLMPKSQIPRATLSS